MRKLNSFLTFLMACFMYGCMSEGIKPDSGTTINNAFSNSTFAGCTAATGTSTSTIDVSFTFPEDATEVQIYRNGLLINTTTAKDTLTFEDTGLEEGKTYMYTCYAKIDDKITPGVNKVQGTTIAVNAPVFSGINTASLTGPTGATVTWLPATGGATVSYYQIFATRGTSVDFSQVKTTVPVGSFSYALSNLSDQMNYAFGVRACNSSNVCDTNSVELARTTVDKGVPTSTGATAGILDSGKVKLTIPWTEAYGAVFKRNVYRSTTNSIASILASKILSPLVADQYNPGNEIEDNTVSEGVTYYYIVRDEDPSGQEESNTNIITVSIGDLTAPNSFTGLTSALVNTASSTTEETEVLLTFNTIDHTPAEAVNYLVYRTEADHPASPSDPCLEATPVLTLPASSFTANTVGQTHTVTGLTTRKKYSFCMKAQDAATNISNTTAYRNVTMKDNTSPVFDGIQGLVYDSGNDKFNVTWNPRTGALAGENTKYFLRVWKNTATPSMGAITNLVYDHGTNPSGVTFGKTDFPFSDGDTVYAIVDVCDDAFDAGAGYAAANNCSSYDPVADDKNVYLNDTTPPANWFGATAASAPFGQGFLKVDWGLPGDISDYNSFKFYHVEKTGAGVNDYTKQFLDVKVCPAGDCTGVTSHILNLATTPLGSRDRHDYRIHVSAVDAFGNETKVGDAAHLLDTQSVTSLDTTDPSFTSNLGLNINGGADKLELTWNAATDNQHPKQNFTTSNGITYSIYRKTSFTDFDFPTEYDANEIPLVSDPEIDLVTSGVTTLGYDEVLSSLTEGQKYYYIVCAVDSSNNHQCDRASIKNTTITDNTAPTLAIAITQNPNAASWDLKLTTNDAPLDPTSVRVDVWRKFSDTNADFPVVGTDQYLGNQMGQGTAGSPTQFTFISENLTDDVSGTNHYVSYRVRVTDSNANQAEFTHTHIIRAPHWNSAVFYAAAGFNCQEDIVCNGSSHYNGGSHRNTYPGAGLDAVASGLGVTIHTPPSHGTISHCYGLDGSAYNDKDCQYTPTTAHWNGTDSAVLCIKDNVITTTPGDYLACKTMEFAVAAVNDPPILANNIHTVIASGGAAETLDLMNGLVDVDNTGETFTITDIRIMTAGKAMSGLSFSSGTHATFNHTPGYYLGRYFSNHGLIEIEYDVSDGTATTTQNSTVKIYSPYTWTGNGGDNLVSNTANWCGTLSSSIGGTCQGAASPPGTNAWVVFNELCETNCSSPTITADVDMLNIDSIMLNDNFGKLVFNPGIRFTHNGCNFRRFMLSSGAEVDFTNAGDVELHEISVVEGSTFRAPANLSIGCKDGSASNPGANTNYIGSGFVHNNGNVKVHGYKYQDNDIRTHASTVFYNMEVDSDNKDYDIELKSSVDINIANNLTITNGLLKDNGLNKVIVGGNVVFKFTDGATYGSVSNVPIVMTGLSKTFDFQHPTEAFAGITVDSNGTVSSVQTNPHLEYVHVKDGTFTAPSGTMTLTGDSTGFDYVTTGVDDSKIEGLRLHTDGTFNHNNGKVFINSNNASQTYTHYRFGIYTEKDLDLNDFEIKASGTTNSAFEPPFTGGSSAFSVVLLNNVGSVNVAGDFTHTDGKIHGGEIAVAGDAYFKCSSSTTSPCARGGFTKVKIANNTSVINMENESTAPVMEFNNGVVNSITGAVQTNLGFNGISLKGNSSFTAPIGVPSFRIGGSYKAGSINVSLEQMSKLDHLIYLEAGSTYNHNGTDHILYHNRVAAANQNSVSNKAGSIYAPNGITFDNLEFNLIDSHGWGSHVSSFVLDGSSSITVDGLLKITEGGISGGTVYVKGNMQIEQETRYLNTHLYFNSTGNQTITMNKTDCSAGYSIYFDDITIDKSGGNVDLTTNNLTPCNSVNNLNIFNGDTFNLNSNTVNYSVISDPGGGLIP